jgi:hypothetical protein
MSSLTIRSQKRYQHKPKWSYNDIKNSLKNLKETPVTINGKSNEVSLEISTPIKLTVCKVDWTPRALNLSKSHLKLFKLTHPSRIKKVQNMQNYVKSIVKLYHKIEELQKPINNTPATVGEYYTKYLKNKCSTPKHPLKK